jgi:hypothetical protein
MSKTMVGPETETQLIPVDVGFCETQTCRGERAAFAVWRPDTSLANRHSLCKKCALELVQNLPDKLVEEALGSVEEIEEENDELEELVKRIKRVEEKRFNVITTVLESAADGVIGKNQLVDILKEHGYLGENGEILSYEGNVVGQAPFEVTQEPGKEEQNDEGKEEDGTSAADPGEEEGSVPAETQKPLEDMNNKELRAIAKEKQIKGYSQMTNAEIIEKIKAVEE